MLTKDLEVRGEPGGGNEADVEPEPAEILKQLERVVGSSLFRNSKRYPSLLRYIVGEFIAGRSDALKERALGIEVFGRDPDYDTNADPVVRISAGEVRKRIAQYYQERGHEDELRIEIPLGSYQPRFFRPFEDRRSTQTQPEARFRDNAAVPPELHDLHPEPTASSVITPTSIAALDPPLKAKIRQPRFLRITRLHLIWIYGLLLCALIPLILFGWQKYQGRQLRPGAAFFWDRLLHSSEPTLIVLGVHSFDAQGNDISYVSHVLLPQTQQTLLSAMTRSDMVQLNDLTSYVRLTTLLTQNAHSFYTQGATDTTLEQLRRGPFVLIGGFNNLWTTNLTKQLRFRFVTLQNGRNCIQDSQRPERIWTLDTQQKALSNTRDYGMVDAFFDQETDQYVLIVAGIGMSGTEAASEFLTNEQGLAAWLQSSKSGAGDNVQIILSTDVIEGKPGQPQIVESFRW
ncbi:hypothetical protein [Granulicella tundricola]|uniref:Adenylate cyclase n=1 Tax=Granulicella tundricola (strain ATCC BAA-1859 / DSM 23138 / MP5ACTX9) TaxID=1198114 RepID=E8X6K4_GRATM|nr:hypothetical protein [Granulicella tundricola]ADW71154.1 hypothetical protein AciX9_3872 [Granulicella tundricola MP5ACTX9]